MLSDIAQRYEQKKRNEVLAQLRWCYATAGKEHKVKLLNQAVELLGYHRKAAIRALRQRRKGNLEP